MARIMKTNIRQPSLFPAQFEMLQEIAVIPGRTNACWEDQIIGLQPALSGCRVRSCVLLGNYGYAKYLVELVGFLPDG